MTRWLRRAGFHVLVAGIFLYLVFPLYYAFVTSLESGSEIFHVSWWPRSFDFSNYVHVFSQQPFGKNLLNSFLVATAVVAISLLLGLTAAFALGRVHFRGRRTLLLSILGVSMFPQVAVLSGLFEVIRTLHLYDNLLGLVLAYTVFTLPFTVWVLTTFIRELPLEIEEAAILDGATPWQLVTRVFFPLLGPALITTGLLAFIVAWNEFLFALTFTLDDSQRTVPVAIALISGGSQHELPWANIMAACVTITVPLIVLVLVFQRRLVAGLTVGAVKG